MREPHRVLLSPLITEKSNLQKEMMNQLVFEVDRRANKIEIRQAVEQAFNVKVMKVRTVNMMGKKKRLGSSGNYSTKPLPQIVIMRGFTNEITNCSWFNMNGSRLSTTGS